MFTVTKDKALLTTTTGALPRPSWYTANLRGMPLSQGFSQQAYREQHFDCLACHVAAQHRAGIDIFVDGDTRLDDDVAGRSWVSYATERIEGIGAPRVEVPPAGFMADKGPGDLMWEVIETRMTPPVIGQDRRDLAAARPRLQGDRADDRQAGQDRLDLGADPRADADRRALQGPAPAADGPVGRAQPRIPRAGRCRRAARADRGAGDPSDHRRPEPEDQTREMGRGVQRRGQGPARQVRGVVPHLLGQPGGAARGEPRISPTRRRCPISTSSTSTSSRSRARSTTAWTSSISAR